MGLVSSVLYFGSRINYCCINNAKKLDICQTITTGPKCKDFMTPASSDHSPPLQSVTL